MAVLQTDRLTIRRFSTDDAPFIVELLNAPGFLRFIGDRGVRNLDDARNYLLTGPIAMYERFGFGLFHVALKDGDVPIGMCGLLKRDTLPDADIGYAFLPQFEGRGYAVEAANGVMDYGRTVHRLKRILAVTMADNDRSVRVLERIGMKFEGMIDFHPGEPPNRLFAWEDAARPSSRE